MRTENDIIVGQQMVQSLINYCKRLNRKTISVKELEMSIATLDMELLTK